MNAAEFERSLRAEGFEIDTRSMPAGTRNREHEHPYDVRALVLAGRIDFTVNGVRRSYAAGEVFTMAAGCLHAEDVGGDGVRHLVGRRRS
jgi:quercetin dioxygenase-like cupin family protein